MLCKGKTLDILCCAMYNKSVLYGGIMEHSVYISWLLDFYGALLTDRQQQAIRLHYDEDLSLAEVAQRLAISRQGVHDLIRRGVERLEQLEQTLNLLARHVALGDALQDCLSLSRTQNNEQLTVQLERALRIWEE